MRTRAEEFGLYIVENNTTIRATAVVFGVSKSTVHNDISKKLRYENLSLYNSVKVVLDRNFKERHIRGGRATKEKYKRIKKCEIL